MFCKSLKRRTVWASATSSLVRGHWKEAHLDTHDVSFQVSGQAEPDATFRLLLLSTQEASLGDDSKRIERLSVVSGGRNIAIVLLLTGDDAMTAFSNLQVETLVHGIEVPIIPITSSSDLVSRIDQLRAHCVERFFASTQSTVSQRVLLSRCVKGMPLPERQTNLVMDLSSSFRELTGHAFDADGEQVLCDLLGKLDSQRLISFLKEGPSPSRF